MTVDSWKEGDVTVVTRRDEHRAPGVVTVFALDCSRGRYLTPLDGTVFRRVNDLWFAVDPPEHKTHAGHKGLVGAIYEWVKLRLEEQ